MLSGDETLLFDKLFLADPAGYGSIRYAAELTTKMNETWFAISELALGLAGFAGVSAAFSGRDRVFQPIERIRFLTVLQTAGNTLVGTLLLVTLDHAEIPQPSALRVAGALGLAVTAFLYTPQMIWVVRNAGARNSTSESWAVWISALYTASLILAYGTQVLKPTVAWPIIAAFSLQISFGVWMFARFLTRPN